MRDWDERWSHGEHSGSEPSPVLVEAVRGLPPGRALDLASGAGRNALYLADEEWEVTAVDSSETAIRIAKMRAIEMSVPLDASVLDLTKEPLPFDDASFELVLMFFYMQRSLFPQIVRWLRPGGVFVAAVHIEDDRDGIHPMNPDYLLAPGELRELLDDLEILAYREGDPRDEQHRRRTAEVVARRKGSVPPA